MSTYIGEAEVSKAKLKWSGNDTGAVCSTSWVLQLGQKEGRVSWKVADLVEVKVNCHSADVRMVSCLTLDIPRPVSRPHIFEAA